MQMNTSYLTGAALDWAVDECLNGDGLYLKFWKMGGDKRYVHCQIMQAYSVHWGTGGPIIESEKIELYFQPALEMWCAKSIEGDLRYGDTPLIAAMRCYVTSKMGETVDVPDALVD